MSGKLSPADAKWVAKAREDFIERVDGKEIAALRARVAKLEALLIEVRPQIYGDCYELQRKINDALKDAPHA